MSDLSPVSGSKRKLGFGAVRAAFDPGCVFIPPPLTGVRYQPPSDEILDCCFNCELYLSRICRPVFSCHAKIPYLVLNFRLSQMRFFSSPSIWVASRSHWRVAATSWV